jgi:hypothetical protein
MFHWLYVGVHGDESRLITLWNDGANILSTDRGWRDGEEKELAQLMMDAVRLGRIALRSSVAVACRCTHVAW